MKALKAGPLPAISRLSDFPREGVVYVGSVRSPCSRGSLASLSLPHLPRGFLAITASDVPGSPFISASGASVPLLASDRVAYRGQPVALIVGPDRGKVEEAIALTSVKVLEEEPDYGFEACESRRVVATERLGSGDVEGALAASARVVEGEYGFGPQDHYYPEPQGAIAAFDYDKLVIYSSTQWPFHVRDSVAASLGVKRDEVVVRPTSLACHLDGKLWYPSLLACHAALAAKFSGSTALVLLSRTEDFLYTTKRAPSLVSYRAGLDETGRLTALDARIMLNTGAYAPFADELVSRAARAAIGPYACPAVRLVARAIRSDLPPMGAFVGLGTGPASFAAERLAEDCATACDMDPSDWRALNAVTRGDRTLGAAAKRAAPFGAIADRLLAISDYPRKRSSYEIIRKRRPDPSSPPGFGIGLAFAPQMPPGSFGREGSEAPAVELTLSKDSTLSIATSLHPGGKSTEELWRAMAASLLDISPDKVVLRPPSTDEVPDSGPGTLSRSIVVVTRLIAAACEALSARRFREALPISVRKAQRARSLKAAPESPLDEASWGGAVVELELDPIDDSPRVRGIWLVAKVGRILSPEAAIRSLKHDAAQALGLCVGERLDIAEGPARAEDLWHYRLPRIKDAPRIVVDFIDDDADPKGLGELAYALIPAAFSNALSQALDVPWNQLPLDGKEGRARP